MNYLPAHVLAEIQRESSDRWMRAEMTSGVGLILVLSDREVRELIDALAPRLPDHPVSRILHEFFAAKEANRPEVTW